MTNGIDYPYAITAINKAGKSQWRETIQPTPKAADDTITITVAGAAVAGGALLGTLMGRAIMR
ncbi:MAG: hypothetical protein H5T41_00015 [Methanomassiliicoccales archaeon]|nr:hypothetical protein [Methanomassiliicoccales archaeon]